MTQPFCCDITSGTKQERKEFMELHNIIKMRCNGKPYFYTLRYYGIASLPLAEETKKEALAMFTRILPLSEGIAILKELVGEEEKPTEKTLTISDVMALLPSSEIIESNGIEGGLRDGELQMFWEGAEWLKKYIENKLTPKPTE